MLKPNTFLGFRRSDNSIGVRNHVAIISIMDNSNPVARQICKSIKNAIPICATFGRGAMGPDIEQHRRTIVGLSTNPNVNSAILLSLESKTIYDYAQEISNMGRRVETIVIQKDGGTIGATEKGIKLAADFLKKSTSAQRELCDLSELVVGLECGGSDATSGLFGNIVTGKVSDFIVSLGGTTILSETAEILGAEHLLAKRSLNQKVANRLLEKVSYVENYANSLGIDLIGTNPVPDNIAGGLSTIEEKSLGAVKKAGSSVLQEVIDYGARPTKKGFIFMDGPAPAIENMTGLAAAGAHIIIFYTGQGNHSGNPIVPVIKSCGNPETLKMMPYNIDVDLTRMVTGQLKLSEASDYLLSELLQVASGKLTSAEILDQGEIAISRKAMTV
jgi:altronate dehydratase large subunit